MNELVFDYFSRPTSPDTDLHHQLICNLPSRLSSQLFPHVPEIFMSLELCTCYSLCGRLSHLVCQWSPIHHNSAQTLLPEAFLDSQTGSSSLFWTSISPYFCACLSSPLHQNYLRAGISLIHLSIPASHNVWHTLSIKDVCWINEWINELQ